MYSCYDFEELLREIYEELYCTEHDRGYEMWKYKLKTYSLFYYYNNKEEVSNIYWIELLNRIVVSEVENLKQKERVRLIDQYGLMVWIKRSTKDIF